MTPVHDLTRDYESWLRQQIPVVEADLGTKHVALRRSPFEFFRGTYYLWLARVPDLVPAVLDTVSTPVVGDLHAENFGTFRDDAGDLRWGINDFDEVSRGPWLLDPLRLAVSVALTDHVPLKTSQVVDTILDAYARAEPAPSVLMDDRRTRHLSALVPRFKDADAYFTHLASGTRTTSVPPSVVKAADASVPGRWDATWHDRVAGTGSLGHRRVVGVGRTVDGWAAREAKQLDPGTAAWAADRDRRLPAPAPDLYADIIRAQRGPAVAQRIGGWQLRALAPDEVRIELGGLDEKDAVLVVQSMTAAMVTVHGVDEVAWRAARTEARALDRDVFRSWVKTMKQTFEQDFENSR